MGESVDCCVITMTVCGLFDYIHYRMIKWLNKETMDESVDCCVITMTVCGLFDYIHYRMIK